jgi:integrase
MPRLALTARFVLGAKAGESSRIDYFDEKNPGLALRVSPGGRKAWTLIFTSPKDDKRARITLGTYPATSLAAARTRATEARQLLEAKKDPRDVFADQAAGAMTVGTLVESYLEKHVRPNLRTATETERRFNKNIVSVIGGVRLSDLHRRDINRVVDPIQGRGSPIEAAHAFEDMRAMLRWAMSRGDIDRNPADGMRKPAGSTPRERVLSESEVRAVWDGLPKVFAKSKSTQRIVRLCLVIAQRVGEVAGMRRDELDLDAGLWSIPGLRTKNGHPHRVPLPELAVSIIREALKQLDDKQPFVFPNLEGGGPLPPRAVAKTVAAAQRSTEEKPMGRFGIVHWTCHDLRRTAVTGMASLGVAPIVLGHVINHRSVTKAGVTMSVYSHYSYAQEQRDALQLWADRLAGLVGGGQTAELAHINARARA